MIHVHVLVYRLLYFIKESLFFFPLSKDLARRIAMTTGFDLVKCRHSIVCTHREGIKFALQEYDRNEEGVAEDMVPPPPQHLDFLEVLSEISFRLLPVDRTGEKGMSV